DVAPSRIQTVKRRASSEMVRYQQLAPKVEGVNGAFFGDKRAQLNTPSWWAEAHKGANSAHRYFYGFLFLRGIYGKPRQDKTKVVGIRTQFSPALLNPTLFSYPGVRERTGEAVPFTLSQPQVRFPKVEGSKCRAPQDSTITNQGNEPSISRRSRP